MNAMLQILGRKTWRTIASIRTGIVLVILVVLAAASGTIVLQRPVTDPVRMARAYSPETLHWLDRLGLTDVFHSWWFTALLGMLCASILLTSIDRLPGVWRFFSRPYRKPEPHFLSGLKLHQEIPIENLADGLNAAEAAFKRMGFNPQRVESEESLSLFAERYRFSRLAAYVVHVSLMLILAGGIVDGVWGYLGYLTLTKDEQSNRIELTNGTARDLPFTVRCEGAGREDYPDGTPRRWWSRLEVLDGGRRVTTKTIEVNEPLVYRGVRFYQSGYGTTGDAESVRLLVQSKADPTSAREFVLQSGQEVPLDAETTVSLAAFIPDFILRGNRVETRSEKPNNPAIELRVVSRGKQEAAVWLFPRYPEFAPASASPYTFAFRGMEMEYFTGLQVSHEPGQWMVWAGVLLMGAGLVIAFYFVHVRVWAVPIADGRGHRTLWVGASSSKNREEVSERFERLVGEIERELERIGKRARSGNARVAEGKMAARVSHAVRT